MIIWLIGYMGSGKTTLGRRLAEHHGLAFVDVDHQIMNKTRMEVSSIFQKHGESYFRVLERQFCLQLGKEKQAVVATGGGLPIHSFTVDEMKVLGQTIYLEADIEELWRRVQKRKRTRPLATTQEDFVKRFETRKPIYEMADVRFDTTSSGLPSLNM